MKQLIKKLAIVLSVALVCAPMGAMAANKLIVKDATGVIDKMVVTDTGYIGSGTSSPTAAVHAVGSTSGASQIRAHFNGLSASGGGSFVMLHNNGSNTALPVSGDRIGAMYFGTQSIVPATGAIGIYYGAGISIKAEGNWVNDGVTTSFPASMAFETASGASKIERLRIASNGNIGIGSTVPTQKLEVSGGIRIVAGAKPTCDLSARGTFWVTRAATNVADSAEVCVKLVDNTYAWKALF